MKRPTRRSIGDPKGFRSLYVVEYWTGGNLWVQRGNYAGGLRGALLGERYLKLNYPHEKFRIALYARVEAEKGD